jgi:hypothetical protein
MPENNASTTANPYTAEWRKKTLAALREPFDPDDINWKPQTVDYKKKKAMAVASADIRAYMDRLNEVVGPESWTQSFQLTVTPYKRIIRAKLDYKEKDANGDLKVLEPERVVDGNKVFVVATVYIEGLGSHSSTGEEDASDENAATSAEAQAFKRACVAFGLGRYLYDLPKQEIPYEYGKFQVNPQLPDWALPKRACQDCTKNIEAFVYKKGNTTETIPAQQVIARGRDNYGKDLCAECQRKRKTSAVEAAGGRLGTATETS